jgi:adenosylcobinamide-GDP ribazoletransferase
MRNFITCLEFLTRIRFSNRTTWNNDDFSKSVPYFPIVGLIIGVFMALVNYGLVYIETPTMLRAAIIFLSEIIITGGLMYDGFMDTSDGIFSARDREKMLVIMKDSCVGANAVLAMIVLTLLKITAYSEIDSVRLSYALIAMAVSTRTFMVLYIINFKYARKTGIGHMFKEFSKPSYTIISFAIGAILLYFIGMEYLFIALITLIICIIIAKYISNLLGGLTGDTYGALTEVGNTVFLLITYYILR